MSFRPPLCHGRLRADFDRRKFQELVEIGTPGSDTQAWLVLTDTRGDEPVREQIFSCVTSFYARFGA